MLFSTPKGVGGKETFLWESMTPLSYDMLSDYLDQAVESNHIDMWANGVIYDEWSGGNCGDGNETCSFFGMRYPYPFDKHGIVRTQWSNGTVEEGTWYSANEGDPATKWGLTRLIDDGRIYLQFWKDGIVHFQSTFNGNFVELDRFYKQ